MGKGSYYYTAPQGARKGPSKCMGHCGKRIVWGDRCPACAQELRLRLRQRRKPR